MTPILNNNATTTVKTKKDDLPGRKRAKKTPTEGKVSKKSASSLHMKSKKKSVLDSSGALVVHKKQHRFKPGSLAEIEIRRFQRPNSPELLVPKVAVFRLIKEIMGDIGDYRLSREAFYALRVELESEAVKVLASANRMATHASRVTIMPSDFDAVTDVRTLFPDASMRDKKHNTRYLEAREKRYRQSFFKSKSHASRSVPSLKNRVEELSTVDESAGKHHDNNPTGYD